MATEYIRKTDDEIRQLVKDMLSGAVFTSQQIDTVELLPMVFMPLAMIGKERIEELQAANIIMFYEYMHKAGPRGINGYPMFLSMQVLNLEDATRLNQLCATTIAAMDAALAGGVNGG